MDIYKEISLVLGVRVTEETFDFKLKRVAASGGFTAKHQEQIIIILVKRLGEIEKSKEVEKKPSVDLEDLVYKLADKVRELETKPPEEEKSEGLEDEPKEPKEDKKKGPAKEAIKPKVKIKEAVAKPNKVAPAKKVKESKPKKSDDKKTDK